MSLNYFLHCQENYNLIMSHIEETIHLYDEIINDSYEYYNSYENDKKPINILCDIEAIIQEKEVFEIQLKKINEIKTKYNKIAQTICIHDFCKDYIDISPERSQTIEYCLKCGFTK